MCYTPPFGALGYRGDEGEMHNEECRMQKGKAANIATLHTPPFGNVGREAD